MVRFQTDLRVWLASMLAVLTTTSGAPAATMVEDAALACGGLAGSLDAVRIDSATLQTPSQLAVSERAPTPAARIAPATQHSARCSAISSRPIPRRHRSSLR